MNTSNAPVETAVPDAESSSQATWRRTIADLDVTFVWAYDTVAILDDYYDSEAAVLPSGQLLRFSAITEESPDHVLCDLDDCRFVESACLPGGRLLRNGMLCRATRLQAVLSLGDYQSATMPAERPPWLIRLIRRLRQ